MLIRKDWLLIGSNEHSTQLMMSSACHRTVEHAEEDEDEEELIKNDGSSS